MSIDDDLDRLLQRTFDEARPTGGEDLRGLRARAVTKAQRIRRRRWIGTASVSALATLGLVAGVGSVVGGGWPGQGRASTAVTPAGEKDPWADLAVGPGNFAYGFPKGLDAISVPQGLDLVADGRLRHPAAQDAGPLRLAGTCTQLDNSVESRASVAYSRWDFTGPGDPTGETNGGELATVGFTSGTGADALRDFKTRRGPCFADPELESVPWQGPGEGSALFQTSPGLVSKPLKALAVVRVGDVLVFGSSRSATVADASDKATSIATAASKRLVGMGYPPALGRALGKSAKAPNAASAIGAPEGERVTGVNAYDFGDVMPDAASLPHGVVYDGSPKMGTNAAPVMGVQSCDSGAFDDPGAMDAAPKPVALVSALAWAGQGQAGVDAVDITVSGWATGSGAERFADLQGNAMTCRFSEPYERLTWTGRDAGTTWLSRHRGASGWVFYLAAQRVGDVIVAVVTDQQGEDEAAKKNAIRLSDEVVAKLRASNLPAAKGR